MATAVIAAAGQHQPAGIVLAETVVTLLVFWLAHVYAQVLSWWGVLTARRLGRAWPAALFAGAVDGALGVVIIALKALLP